MTGDRDPTQEEQAIDYLLGAIRDEQRGADLKFHEHRQCAISAAVLRAAVAPPPDDEAEDDGPFVNPLDDIPPEPGGTDGETVEEIVARRGREQNDA